MVGAQRERKVRPVVKVKKGGFGGDPELDRVLPAARCDVPTTCEE